MSSPLVFSDAFCGTLLRKWTSPLVFWARAYSYETMPPLCRSPKFRR